MDEEKCAALLIDATSGSVEALAKLYAEAGRAVFAYAFSILHSKQLAEDVTHDVFVKIRLGQSGYAAHGSARGWLLRLTRNAALDLQKKRGREISCELPETPTAESVDTDDKLMLREALKTLSSAERQVVMLYLVAGVTQKEIAGILKLPVTTVNWYYRAGIKKLARTLKGDNSND